MVLSDVHAAKTIATPIARRPPLTALWKPATPPPIAKCPFLRALSPVSITRFRSNSAQSLRPLIRASGRDANEAELHRKTLSKKTEARRISPAGSQSASPPLLVDHVEHCRDR